VRDVLRFVQLDIWTIRTDAKPRSYIIAFLFTFAAFVAIGETGIFVMWPVISFLCYAPFIAGKDGLDCLYASLSINRKTVVWGRYLFTYSFTLLIVSILFIIGCAILTLTQADFNFYRFLVMSLSLFFVSSIFSAINTPLLFRFGFKKIRMHIGLMPLLLVLLTMLIAQFAGLETDQALLNVSAHAIFNRGNVLTVFVGASLWLAVVATSIALSFKFYYSRDF